MKSEEEVEKVIKHFGIKGMRWGVRKKSDSSGSGGNSGTSKPKKELDEWDAGYAKIDAKYQPRIAAAKAKEKEAIKKAKDDWYDEMAKSDLDPKYERYSVVALKFDRASRKEYNQLLTEEHSAWAAIDKKKNDRIREAKAKAKAEIRKTKDEWFDETWDFEELMVQKDIAKANAVKKSKAEAKAAKLRGSDDNAAAVAIKKKKLRDMTDDEVRTLTTRLTLVDEYKSLTPLLSGKRKDTTQLSNAQIKSEITRRKLEQADWKQGVRKDKRISDMTDIEIERTAARHALEQNYKQLQYKEIQKAANVVQSFHTVIVGSSGSKKRR